jgi:hypothetical protein
MKPTKDIIFEELETTPTDILNEIAETGMEKQAQIDPEASRELRRRQVARLEDNIVLLRRKQEEFNRKMEEYIQNIRALIGSLERNLAAEARVGPAPVRMTVGSTQVRCLSCGQEKVFEDFRVIAARDSEESLDRPTVLIVEESGKIKKGIFSCPQCGNENLLIRKLPT